jgi:cupin superfamily acireductone dioxygenase involved in methionine salvage
MANTKINFDFNKLRQTISKSEDAYAKKIAEYEKKVEELFRKKNFKAALELSVSILQQLDQEKVEDEIIVRKILIFKSKIINDFIQINLF